MIARFDRATCGTLADEVAALLEALAARHGLDVRPAGGSFSDAEYTLKVRFRVKDPDAGRAAFDRFCRVYGLEPDDLGREFTTGAGTRYRLVGLAPNRPRYPIRAVDVATGKESLFTEGVVARIVAARPSK